METFIFETIRDEGPRHEWKRIQELVEKADRSLKAVERLRQSEDNDFAISRAYYAMFYYVVQALLLRGRSPSEQAFWRDCRLNDIS